MIPNARYSFYQTVSRLAELFGGTRGIACDIDDPQPLAAKPKPMGEWVSH